MFINHKEKISRYKIQRHYLYKFIGNNNINQMRKIAFITSGHSGATLPLAKEFISLGWQVDYYFLFVKNRKDQKHSVEAMTLEDFLHKKGVHEIESKYYRELSNYMCSDSFRMLYICTSRPFKKVPVLRNIMKICRLIEYIPIFKYLKKEKYDLINLVGRIDCVDDFYLLHRHLNAKIITSLHEVCNHYNPNFETTPSFLKYLFNKKKEIVVHSRNSYNDIIKYKDVYKDKIHHINFGVFETYRTIKGSIDIELPENYVLFFGIIKPYKGLVYLLDAIKKHPECLGDNKLVIAGSGFDDSISEFKRMNGVVVINRYIENEELIYLVEHSRFVICPYITISQSGLPQTIYAFNKPIIASDLDGFKEVIVDNKIGLLFKSQNSDELAKAIKELSSDSNLYNSMINNIRNFDNINYKYSWNYIAQQYLKI